MKVLTGKQMRVIEEFAFEKLGFNNEDLMHEAANELYIEILNRLASIGKPLNKALVVLICGKGNNGQDAIILSKILAENGINKKVYLISELEESDKPEILSKIKQNIIKADIVVDGIFGTGLSRDVIGLPLILVELINEFSNYTMSIDVPSGISSEDGNILGHSVCANQTVTFQCPKLGCLIFPGAESVGKLSIRKIGLPEDLINKMSDDHYYIDEEMIKKAFTKRKRNSYKGNYGKVLVVAGSKGMAGAAALCAKAALRSGAGLVRISANDDILDIVQCLVPEATCVSRNEIITVCNEYDSIIVGPGLGISKENEKLVLDIIKAYEGNLILDADALSLIKGYSNRLKKSKANIIITPHEGEAAKLLDIAPNEINKSRISACKNLVSITGATVILKGAITLIGTKDGSIYFNNTGNPGMSTGGSGDVLAGIVGSFAAQGIGRDKVAQISVYIHGLAGDVIKEEIGELGLISSDLAIGVAKAIAKFEY